MYGNVLVLNDAGFAQSGQIYDGEFNIDKLLQTNICHQAIFYRSSLFKKLGKYNLAYSVCADWGMNMRFFSSTKVRYVDLTIAYFRGGGLSSGINVQDLLLEKDLPLLRRKYFFKHFLYRKIKYSYNQGRLKSSLRTGEYAIVKST